MAQRVALVTGGSRGIGAAVGVLLASQGWSVALVGRDPDALSRAIQACELGQPEGAQTAGFSCDLSRMDDLPVLVQSVVERFGRVDALVHSAGLWVEQPLERADLGVWDAVLDVNLRAVIHLTHAALPHLVESKSGAVVVISSTAGRRTYANGGLYCASKYGVMGFAGALFEELREQNIKVCAICPGVVNTDMHDPAAEGYDAAKMIQPADVALSVGFVLNSPSTVCPTEVVLMPQRNPKLR
jgi:NADP-dependent 3-hydroxy acid dehydrogenase YdfG